MEDDAKKLEEVLQQSGKADLKVLFAPMPEENHLTILHNSVYKAFTMIYKKE